MKIEFENLDQFSLEQPTKGGKPLSQEILTWIDQKSVLYHIPGFYKGLFRGEINIPFFNEHNRVYSPGEFGIELQQFLKKLFVENKISDKEVELRVIGRRIELWLR